MAKPEQWNRLESLTVSPEASCILELRARVEALEAQAGNYPEIPDSSTQPPVATDEELRAIWRSSDTELNRLRNAYNLGVAHGQARSREVAEPAPVAGELVARRIGYELSQIRRSIEGPAND
jgi:hypothetical protein